MQAILLDKNGNDVERTLLTRGLVARYLISMLAIGLVAGSVLYSGVIQRGPAKDVDARYFYAAAKCWAGGRSPYEAAVYYPSLRAEFANAPDQAFAYPPTLMLVVLPMAYFDWPAAAMLFSLMNFGAAMVLFWACYRLVRESLGGPLGPAHWVWVVLASTMGGVAGTIFTGQSSVFIAAACALALVGCRLQWPWLTVIGLVIATAKPQLSFPLLLFIPWFEPKQRKAFLLAAAIVVLPFVYAAMVDPHIVQSCLNSVASYGSIPANNPAMELGSAAILSRMGISRSSSQMLGVLCSLAVLFLAARMLHRSGRTLSGDPATIMLLVFSIGLAMPIHEYDSCCYAVGIALLATSRPAVQAVLLLPALLIWRPERWLGIFHLGNPVDAARQIGYGQLFATFAWLALLLGALVMCFATGSNTRLRDRRM
jgi:hypothetical protein